MRHQIIQKTNKMVLENETTQNVSPISELQRLHRDRSVLKTNTQKRKIRWSVAITVAFASG